MPARRTENRLVVKSDDAPKRFLAPCELANRWCCSRASVERIATRNGLSRFYLGEGRHGIVRYLLDEVVKFEESRRIACQHR